MCQKKRCSCGLRAVPWSCLVTFIFGHDRHVQVIYRPVPKKLSCYTAVFPNYYCTCRPSEHSFEFKSIRVSGKRWLIMTWLSQSDQVFINISTERQVKQAGYSRLFKKPHVRARFYLAGNFPHLNIVINVENFCLNCTSTSAMHIFQRTLNHHNKRED